MNRNLENRGARPHHPEPATSRAPAPYSWGRTVIAVFLTMLWVVSCDRDASVTGARPPGPLYQDLSSLAAAAPFIVVGMVTKIEAGRVAGAGEDRLAFNDIFIRVERLLKGKLDDPFIVEQVAHVEKVVSPGVGPPYRVGERYLLFLQPGEGRRFIPVVQGRFRIDKGLLNPLDPGPAADSLKGMGEDQVLKKLTIVPP